MYVMPGVIILYMIIWKYEFLLNDYSNLVGYNGFLEKVKVGLNPNFLNSMVIKIDL